MTNNKGITLIALVITIIVLLILAGVSIAMLTGQNGILTQATNAKSETARAEAVEKINMTLNAIKAQIYEKQVDDSTWSPAAISGSGTAATATDVKSDVIDLMSSDLIGGTTKIEKATATNGKYTYNVSSGILTIYYANSEQNIPVASPVSGELNLESYEITEAV